MLSVLRYQIVTRLRYMARAFFAMAQRKIRHDAGAA